MRIISTVITAVALIATASPALAHHKQNHPDFPRTSSVVHVMSDPCAVSNNPHVNAADRALAERCRQLLDQSMTAPNDAALRERCDRAVEARSGRTCA